MKMQIDKIVEYIPSCSFCGKSQKDSDLLIAGPDNNFICNECVELSMEIITKNKIETRLLNDDFYRNQLSKIIKKIDKMKKENKDVIN